jgi:chaperone modulatory protein CbpM
MSIDITDITLLDDHHACSVQELVDVSGLSAEDVALLVEHGVIVPVAPPPQPPEFYLRYIVIAKTARRLRDDFELDSDGWLLALTLMRRLDETETELAVVKAQLARYVGAVV